MRRIVFDCGCTIDPRYAEKKQNRPYCYRHGAYRSHDIVCCIGVAGYHVCDTVFRTTANRRQRCPECQHLWKLIHNSRPKLVAENKEKGVSEWETQEEIMERELDAAFAKTSHPVPPIHTPVLDAVMAAM
jgi:hypothetical protein